MVTIEKPLASDGDDSRFSDLQLSAGSHAKRELWVRPTKNRLANLTPLRFRGNFNVNDSRFIANGILKLNVQITVRFSFHGNYAGPESEPVIFNASAP